MRKKIVAGNWKMNNNNVETITLIEALKNTSYSGEAQLMVAPAFTHLSEAVSALKDHHISVLSQNMNAAESGAYTGEISAQMLKSIGVTSVILGHSERRAYYNESDAALAAKVKTALKHEMQIVFCFGEELNERKENKHFDVVKSQLSNALFDLPASDWSNIILAYEPVWAIGTGETASPEQAQEMHAFIRNIIKEQYDAKLSESISILYGGSVKPQNADAIFSKPDVDGGLIGGAALKAADFMAIANAF
ncbi:triose-phosphate isomerase [Flavobacteriaceae bacterium]|nr:triose-phosphate isomerase [Flavobacteriaceae bacterium]